MACHSLSKSCWNPFLLIPFFPKFRGKKISTLWSQKPQILLPLAIGLKKKQINFRKKDVVLPVLRGFVCWRWAVCAFLIFPTWLPLLVLCPHGELAAQTNLVCVSDGSSKLCPEKMYFLQAKFDHISYIVETMQGVLS